MLTNPIGTTVNLTKIRYDIERAFKLMKIESLMDVRGSSWYVPEIDSLVMRLSGSLLGEILQEQTIEYPSTWWDAFKKEKLKRYFPNMKIQMTRVVISVKALYPELHKKLSIPNESHFIHASKDYEEE